MFHSRGFNDKINYLHERTLRVTNSDKSSSFQDLLKKNIYIAPEFMKKSLLLK